MGLITFEKGTTNSNDVIYISPSGDTTGVTNTDNIEDALLAVAAGGTVVLSEGHFYTSQSFSIFNFHGTLKGQGKDNTIVELVRTGPDEGQGFEPAWDPFYLTYIPCLLYFISPDGDLKIDDLTAQVIEPSPCEPWSIPWSGEETTAITNFFWISDNAFNTELTNLRIKGAPVDDYYGYNMLWSCGVDFSEGDGRTHIVKECDFENVYTALECWEMTGNSKIKIKANTFTNVGLSIAVGNFETTNSMNDIISANTISHIDAIGIWIGATNNHRIKENDISGCGFNMGFLE
jgi:parallel beta-helix repeat protein